MKASYEHIFNGNMELDDGWTTSGSGGVNIHSADQAHSGLWSWKMTVSQYQGIVSDVWTSFTGIKYYFSCWIYNTSSTTLAYSIAKGDGSAALIGGNFTVVQNQWTKFSVDYTETAGGALASVILAAPFAASGLVVYADDVTVTSKVQASPDPYYKKTLNEKKILLTPDGAI